MIIRFFSTILSINLNKIKKTIVRIKKHNWDAEKNKKTGSKTTKSRRGSKTSVTSKKTQTTRGKGKKKAKISQKSLKSITGKVSKKNKISQYIESYTEDCTDVRISFTIKFKPGSLKK